MSCLTLERFLAAVHHSESLPRSMEKSQEDINPASAAKFRGSRVPGFWFRFEFGVRQETPHQSRNCSYSVSGVFICEKSMEQCLEMLLKDSCERRRSHNHLRLRDHVPDSLIIDIWMTVHTIAMTISYLQIGWLVAPYQPQTSFFLQRTTNGTTNDQRLHGKPKKLL